VGGGGRINRIFNKWVGYFGYIRGYLIIFRDKFIHGILGTVGEVFKNVNPLEIGFVVAFTVDTLKSVEKNFIFF